MNIPDQHRILVIDDNRAIHDDFRKILCPGEVPEVDRSEASFFGEALPIATPLAFTVDSAFQGEEGIALLEQALAEGRPYSVAFVDVRMPPGMDGIETAERLWALAAELQVVICTAYSDYSWEQMIEKLGKRDRLLVLKKPFAAIEALQLACALSEKWVLALGARRHLADTERAVEERTRELRAANEKLAAEMEQRIKAEQHLLRAQRIESIGTLASGIAHDLNNLLSPILLSAQMLHNEWPAPVHEELVSTIESSALRAGNIVRQVLTFARGIDGDRVPLQPKRLIREIEKIIGETFPRNLTIESALADDLWLLEGDATQMHQILMNLCVNARDAMPFGGTLRIEAENREFDADHDGTVAGARPGRYVVMRVADTGCGIPKAVSEQIFEPFFTTKPLGKGTGLGLSTVAGIVKSHEGFIELRSAPGQGSTFEIFLPAVRDGAPVMETPAEAEPAPGHGELILVVDDEEQIRTVMEAALSARGYRVITAADGAEALTLYGLARDEIGAVVTDLLMPLVDGIALSRVLQRIRPTVCIIATSGALDETRIQELRALNIRNVLPKPFHTNALLAALQEALRSVAPVPPPSRPLSPAPTNS